MLKKVSLEKFKCFKEKVDIPLSQVTLLYGKNGRGKSTVAQSLLLLAQTMLDNNTVDNLKLSGRFVSLGTTNDIINSYAKEESFGIALEGETDVVEMVFANSVQNPQVAKITSFIFNGDSRFNELGDYKDESESKLLETISDVTPLQMLKSTGYISAGRLGSQHTTTRNDLDRNLGVNGENVINVLSQQGEDFIEKVRKALSNILDGAAIQVANLDLEHLELQLNSKDGEKTYKPINVGFGYSYVLPVIVAAFLAKENSLLIIENPEAHLHPRAQSLIMEFLIEIAKKKNMQLILETHSDHVVNGMRIAIKDGILTSNDAHILYFSDEESPISKITCNKDGALSSYPDDFLDEWAIQLLKLV